MTYDEVVNARVRTSIDRLGEFVGRLNAPAAIIAIEAAMLIERIATRYGPGVYEELGKRTIHANKLAMGFCPFCDGTPNRITDGSMCEQCFTKANADDSEQMEPEPR